MFFNKQNKNLKEKKGEKVASPGNWTPASCVTCQAANHYTTWPVIKIGKKTS